MKIVEVPIKELIRAEYNPRKLSGEQYEQIKSSLLRFGVVDPVIANSNKDRFNIIIGGHQRSLVWSDLGHDTIPVHYVDLTLEKERELNIRLNKNTGEWDHDLLKNFFEDEELMEWGFDESELTIEDVEQLEPEETKENDEVPVQVKQKTMPGDVYVLNGRHRLLCGNSTSLDDVVRLMDENQADLLLTDPPYNVDYEGKTKDALKIENDSMEDADFRQFLRDVYTSADHVMRPGGCFYIWHADFEGYNFRGAAFDIGWQVRQCLIWVKNTMVMGRQDYHCKHEPCLYGWKDGAGHYWGTDRKQTTLLEFDRPTRSEIHPTMKPVALFEYQIMNNTKPKEKVLDLFLGSGTTLIACERTDRQCYGIELDPHYCDVIVQRYVNWCKENNKPCTVNLNGEDIEWVYEC